MDNILSPKELDKFINTLQIMSEANKTLRNEHTVLERNLTLALDALENIAEGNWVRYFAEYNCRDIINEIKKSLKIIQIEIDITTIDSSDYLERNYI